MNSHDKVKIIVAGDSGVGKTSLVSLLCHNEPLSCPYWTIGCSVDVKLHEFKVGTSQEKTFFIELWDVGGWAAHRNSRNLFYQSANGIILVHDLTNRKSHQNMHKWLMEALNKDATYEELLSLDYEQMAGRVSGLPVLVVGTKMDSLKGAPKDHLHKRVSSMAQELGADEISLVIEQRCYQAKDMNSSLERRKLHGMSWN